MKTKIAERFSLYARIKENGVVDIRVTDLRTQATHQLTWSLDGDEVVYTKTKKAEVTPVDNASGDVVGIGQPTKEEE